MKKLLIVLSVVLVFVGPVSSQCDLKLKEKLTEEIKKDGYEILKETYFEIDKQNTSNQSLILQNDFPYRYYVGLSDKYPSEVDFYLTTNKGNNMVTSLLLDKELMTLDFRPTFSGIYEINFRLNRGVKSCGVLILTHKKHHNVGPSKPIIPNDSTAYLVVDDMPQFVEGGTLKAFNDWVNKTISLPAVVKNKGIQGKVYVQFVVNNKGIVDKVKVLKGVDPEVDAYLVDLIKSSPKWHKPGKLQNTDVGVLFVIPIIIQDKK